MDQLRRGNHLLALSCWDRQGAETVRSVEEGKEGSGKEEGIYIAYSGKGVTDNRPLVELRKRDRR